MFSKTRTTIITLVAAFSFGTAAIVPAVSQANIGTVIQPLSAPSTTSARQVCVSVGGGYSICHTAKSCDLKISDTETITVEDSKSIKIGRVTYKCVDGVLSQAMTLGGSEVTPVLVGQLTVPPTATPEVTPTAVQSIKATSTPTLSAP
jgi:hypothetical protein